MTSSAGRPLLGPFAEPPATVVDALPSAFPGYAAADLVDRLAGVVAERGAARLALSGGTTVTPVFDELVALAVAEPAALEWGRVTILQVDERIAPDGDVDRNATSLFDRLVDRLPQRPATVVFPAGRLLLAVDIEERERLLADAIRAYRAILGDEFVCDVVQLGMGPDGHTASLFGPEDRDGHDAEPIRLTGPYQGLRRVTLTEWVLNHALERVVWVSGARPEEPKASLVEHWVAGDLPTALPIGRLVGERTTLITDRG